MSTQIGTCHHKRQRVNCADELDVITDARRKLAWTKRPGVCKKVKRALNKRARRNWRLYE